MRESEIGARDLVRSREFYRSQVSYLESRDHWRVHDSSMSDDRNQYGYFGSDYQAALAHISFGEVYPFELRGLKHEVQSWHRQYKQVMMIDLMGQGRGLLESGADAVVATQLRERIPHEKVHTVEGDMLSPEKIRDLTEFMDACLASNSQPKKRFRLDRRNDVVFSHVFFRPHGGTDRFNFDAYALRQAYTLLREIIARIPAGGRVFIQNALGASYLQDIFEAYNLFQPAPDMLFPHVPGASLTPRTKYASTYLFTKPSNTFMLPSLEELTNSQSPQIQKMREQLLRNDKEQRRNLSIG